VRDSVTVHINAAPERIWPLVSDVTRQNQFAAETFELRNDPALRLYWAMLGWARRKTNVENMRTTLDRIKAAAEAG
jgi:hypothetical protein